MENINPLIRCDMYKEQHCDAYNPRTELIYSTFTPRKSRYNGVDKVVVFGLQYLVKKFLIEDFNKNFFSKPKDEVVNSYLRIMNNTVHNNGIGKERIEKLHDLGYLPIRIDALEEGTLCPMRVPMLTIQNTLPEFYWLTNFLETLICNTLWLPCTSATTALEYRKILEKWADKTCDDNKHVDFQAHDFSLRSMSSMESGAISGVGHLCSFVGTDTIPAVYYAEKYYNADVENELVGTSVMATEHSVQETNILFYDDEDKTNGEYINLKTLLERVPSTEILSYVADTYNQWELIRNVLPKLEHEILSREGKLVIRGDSGDPVDIICGTNTRDIPVEIPEKSKQYIEEIEKGIVELLWETFGGTVNSKGYKVLNPHIGAIYGDGMSLERVEEICRRLESKGFASSNVVLGVGGYSYQYVTRDTFGFALKTTYGVVDGKEILLFKDPITDSGEKKSQKGMVIVTYDKDGNLVYVDELTADTKQKMHSVDLLKPLFKDGKLLRETSLAEIRSKIQDSIKEKELIAL